MQILLLYAIFAVCTYAYHPKFFDLTTGQISNHSVVFIAEVLIIALTAIKVRKNIIKGFSGVYLFCMIAIGILSTVLQGFGYESSFSECKSLLPAFLGLIIGANLDVEEKDFIWALRVYVYCAIVIGYLCISQYLGAFVIADQYLVAGKNASGAMLAIAGIIITYTLLYKQSSNLFKIADLTSLIIVFAELLTIRARLATLGLLAICIFLLSRSGFRIKASYILIGFVGLMVLVFTNLDPVFDFIYNSFFQNKESNFTSNRSDLNRRALEVIADSPFVGNIDGSYFIDEKYHVHNFLLNIVSHYGLILSLPWVILYFKLLNFLVTHIRKTSRESFMILGISMMLLLFWESLGEYTYPFGPGSITFLPFLTLGYAIYHDNNDVFDIVYE